jgi:hypothetical protein
MAEGSSPAPQQDNGLRAWDRVRERASTYGSITALFVALVTVGVFGGYLYSQSKKTPTPTTKPVIQTLSAEDLAKLNEIGANLGTSGQTLNVGANALFRGKADVTGDLTVGGRLNANGPVTLSQLNITGNTAATGLNVGSNLNVTGAHLVSQGSAPSVSAGGVGAGGTVSISGNDTAGTVNINTGTGPGGVLATIGFRAPFGSTVHVSLTPLTGAAADASAFVTRSNAGFQIHANTPPSGQTLSFDYLVVQ